MHSLKVLVLEDSPFQLMAMHQMLNACGVFDVLTAESVDSACQSLHKRGAVDVAICDLHMDGPDGLELIRHLAVNDLAQALVVCSSAAPEVIAEAVQLAREQNVPVLGALPKPATANAIHELLSEYLEPAGPDDQLPLAEVREIGSLDEAVPEHVHAVCAAWQARQTRQARK